jgi:AcrR family transcriptional regulator
MPATTAPTKKTDGRRTERASSKRRRLDILEAARLIFSEEGYDQLTLRNVASKVGIHLKTLQHYFPSKEELVQSMLIYHDETYAQTYEYLRLESDDPEELFRKAMAFLIKDDKDRQTAGFFYQLWARAHNDEHANSVMHGMYRNHCSNIEKLMEPLNPDLPKQARKQRAIMIISMIEGLMLMIGYGKKKPWGVGNLEQQTIELAVKLAKDPDII